MTKKYPILEIRDLSSPSETQRTHPDLPCLPFAMAVIGPSRSGKSNFIKNLLTRYDMLKGVFNEENIFIISQSLRYNDDYEQLEKAQKFEDYSNKLLKEIWNEQDFVIRIYGKERAPDILVVLDDCFDNPAFNRSTIVNSLTMRGRHMKISIIVSGQKWSMISKPARVNLTDVAFFRPMNFSELESFVEELVDRQKRKELLATAKKIYRVPYDFIYYDLLNPDIKRRIRKNMSEIVEFSFL